VAIAGFIGPDRRAVSLTDSSGASGFGIPLVAWAGAAVVLACLPVAAKALPGHLPGDGWPIAAASGVVGLITIAGWLGTWVFSGRAWPAYVGLALVPGWAMAEFAGTPLGALGRESAATFTGLLAPSVALGLSYRASRSADVDTTLRPFRVLGALLAVSAATYGLVALAGEHASVAPPTAVAVTGVASAAAWCLAAQVFRRADGPCSVDRRSLAIALCLFGVAALDRTVARLHPDDDVASWAFSGARSVVLLGWLLLLIAAAHSIRRARVAFCARQHDLRTARDAIAHGLAEQRRRVEERRHDMRSLVSGIQGASSTLARYRGFLDASEQQALEAALLAEIDRLQHALSAESRLPRPFALRVALGPVITAERARGTAVNADLPDVEVLGNTDATAALLQNLVTNARQHAPGATITISATTTTHAHSDTVAIVVSDDGPGLPAAVRERVVAIFDAGQPSSAPPIPRQPGIEATPDQLLDPPGETHGLGLAICARLAKEQGGQLRLRPTGVGTCVELTLRLAANELLGEPL
jgi:signal transduction histidine kinase